MKVNEGTRTLWAESINSFDWLIESVHGDAGKLVYFETMDSRPFGYYVFIDSSCDLELEDWEQIPEVDRNIYGTLPEMIMQMIESECDNIFRYEEIETGLYTCDQDKEEGIDPFEYEFPMFSLGAGYSYREVKRVTNLNRTKTRQTQTSK